MGLLQGKVILVTGAGRGLGRAFAWACAQAGASAVIVADINEEWGLQTSKSLDDAGFDAPFLAVDLGDPASIEKMAAVVGERHGRLDGLVNNAAIATGIGGKGFEEIDIETWDKVMRVNIRGTWLVIRACAPLLRKSVSGARIVNIASDTALWGAPDLLHYVATKGAVIAMTRSLAREMGPDGIAVNTVAPGLTLGEATDTVPPERHAHYVGGRAMPRAQEAGDVVGSVVFLLSDGAAFISGQILPVNGGFVFN